MKTKVYKRRNARLYGGAVIVLSMGLLLYLALVQSYEVFCAGAMDARTAWRTFCVYMLKSGLMIMAMSVLWYFYAVQEYHTVLQELKNILEVSSEKDIPYPYTKDQELALLVDSASGIMKNNQKYQKLLEGQKKQLLNNYITSLMKGRTRNIPAAYQSGEALGIDLKSGNLQVAVIGIGDSDDQAPSDQMVDRIYDRIEALVSHMLLVVFNGHLAEVDGMLACLLFSGNGSRMDAEDNATELKRIVTLIHHIILEETGYEVRIAVGGVSAGISGIEKSFSEAMELLRYAEMVNENNGILVYTEMPSVHMADTDDYFWFKKEMQFMNCINTADYTSAATVFFEILDSDYLNNDLPLKLVNCRVLGLINAMLNALGKIRLTVDGDFFEKLNPWDTILNCKSIPELKRRSRDIFYRINQYTENQKQQSSWDRMTDIIDFLKENYSDSSLSVSSIAEHFQLNPSYLSRIFKKLMGIGLSDYLQWIRVDEAKKLLKKTDLNVYEISQKVGYNGVQTMNRAFKKYEGTTPGRMKRV